MPSHKDFNHYLADPMIWFYYSEIKKTGSIESDVDNFYNNMLKIYFPLEKMYGIEQESRPLKERGGSQRTDFTIRYVKNGSPKKVILMEDKRRGKETAGGQWSDALDQVVKYAYLVRAEENQDPNDIIYITVNIGVHLRFYQLDPNQNKATDFAPANGKAYELAEDEADVHSLFMQLQRLTSH